MKQLLQNVTKTVLDNGLTVLIKENHASPIVAINTYVKAGYFHESDHVVGISHLIEHMFFKGTKRRGVGEIAGETKELGGYLNASTIYDHTLYYTVLPSTHFSRGLDIQSDALMNSTFDPSELQKETEVVIEEAKRKFDTPSAVLREQLMALAFDKHRIRRWRIGTEDGLRALTRDDFLTFYENLYRPENIILTVVGDIETDTALHEIEKYYGGFAKGRVVKDTSSPESPQTRFKYQFLQGDIKQCHLGLGVHTQGFLHEDTYALEILSFILGYGRSSRLVETVKERKNLVHSIYAFNYALEDLGIFFIFATAAPDKLRDAEQAVLEEIAGLREKPVTQEELQRTRNLLESLFMFSGESVAGQADLLASYEAVGDYRLIEDYLEKLYAVQEDDILRVASKYFTTENCSMLEYVPEGSGLKSLHDASVAESCKKSWKDVNVSVKRSGEPVRMPDSVEIIPSPSSGEIYESTLKNGIKLLVKEERQVPIVSMGVFTQGGRPSETVENAGVTRLAVRAALKGTENHTSTELARRTENLGTNIQGICEPDYFGFSVKVLSRNMLPAWKLLSDVIKNPAFPEEEIRKEKENTIATISRIKDDMFRYPLQLFYSAHFGGHSYGLPVQGTPETVTSLNRDALLGWHRRHLRPENMTIVAVGDVQHGELEKLLEDTWERTHGEVRSFDAPHNEVRTKGDRAIEHRKKAQTGIVLGFPGPTRLQPDFYPLLVLQNALSGLGGRFFEELRSRQSLAYTVSTFVVARLYGGAFLSYIATSPEKEEAARQGLLTEFEKLLTDPLSEEELMRSIRYTVGTHKIGLETLQAKMMQMAHYQLLGIGHSEIDRLPEKVEAITNEQILNTARKYIDLDEVSMGIVRGEQ